MPHLSLAEEEQIQTVYRETYAQWGAGLSRRDYRELWDDISATPWARRYASFYVWLDDDGQVLSSLKLYRPKVRVGDRCERASVLGAIFTPRRRRRKGHATALIRAVLDGAVDRGDHVALLFTDIGTDFYRKLGFERLPALEHWGVLPKHLPKSPPGWTMRPMEACDRPAVRQAQSDSARARGIAVVRDEGHWQFLQIRSDSYFRRLNDPLVGQHCRVGLYGGRVAGYLITVEGRGDWNVREIGAEGGDPETMAAIFQLGAVAARRAGLRRLYGWLPAELIDRLESYRLRSGPRVRALPMILPLDGSIDLSRLSSTANAYFPYQDQF